MFSSGHSAGADHESAVDGTSAPAERGAPSEPKTSPSATALRELIWQMGPNSAYSQTITAVPSPISLPTFTPRVWPGIAAPFWALFHPTQAWRIFAPIPPDQAKDIGNQKFTTEGRLEPLGVQPGDPFKE